MVNRHMALTTLSAVLLSAALLTGCPKRITIDGVTYDYEEAAQAAYADAEAARQSGETDIALEKLDSFLGRFDESKLADDALMAIGMLAREQGQLTRARDAFARLAMDYPSSEHAVDARLAMARIDVAEGRPRDAVAPLRAVYDKLDDDETRREVASMLAETLDRSGDGEQALEWYLRAYDEARTDAERKEIYERIFALVDSQLSFRAVRTLSETVDTSSPAGELVLFKLARIYCHLRDFRQCNETVERYLDQHPRGRFLAQAGEMQGRLRARLTVDPTVVGVLLPLSGKYQVYGERALYAIQLGAELIGDKNPGGVKLVVRDSKGETEVAAKMVQELALQEHAVVVIGAILQNTAAAAALKAEELAVPLLSFSRREELTELGGYVFRYGLTNSKQAKALVDLTMGKMGMSRFAILYPRHPYGIELMNAFWDQVDQRKGYVVGAEAYDHDETTFTKHIKKLVGKYPLHTRGSYATCMAEARAIEKAYTRRKALENCKNKVAPAVDFDALLIPDDHAAVGLIAPTLAFEDVLITRDPEAIRDYRTTTGFKDVKPVQLIGANGWNDPVLIERAGKNVEGSLFVDGFNPRSKEPHVHKFVAAFAEAQKSLPTVIDAQAYDGGALVATLLRGKVKPKPKNRADMRRLLAEVKEFPGVTGLTSFDDSGDSVTPLVVFTIDNETIEVAELEEKPKG